MSSYAQGRRSARRPTTQPVARARRPRRRDRRGRGLRGVLLPATVPGARTRAERFDEHVLDVVEHLAARWGDRLEGIEFAVEDVPPTDPSPWEAGEVPLGRFFPADRGLAARVVLYRRPVELRVSHDLDLAELVRTAVVQQVAHALGVSADELDPDHRDD